MEWMWSELFQGHQEFCPMPPKTAALSHPMAIDELAQRFPEAVKKHFVNLGLSQTAAVRSLQAGVSGGNSVGVSGGVSGGISTTASPTASNTTLPPGSVIITTVVGTIAIKVPNCTAFTGTTGVERAVAAGIASESGVDASSVTVALSCSRRLASGLLARRLGEAVNAEYEITIPYGSTTITAASVTNSMVMAGASGLTSKIVTAMTAANIMGMTVTVTNVPQAETQPIVATTAPPGDESSARQVLTGALSAILAMAMVAFF
ncbi:unnamed protein product [Polarella glacialis]|uniref:Uncharacterized protein n=1 Tax=Polarella glacialis TaxID=89957 RepID=A0A813K7V2_POLGL|nr:unnamed protein product [Polarella glacialis]